MGGDAFEEGVEGVGQVRGTAQRPVVFRPDTDTGSPRRQPRLLGSGSDNRIQRFDILEIDPVLSTEKCYQAMRSTSGYPEYGIVGRTDAHPGPRIDVHPLNPSKQSGNMPYIPPERFPHVSLDAREAMRPVMLAVTLFGFRTTGRTERGTARQ
ncbi:hypothetical protein V1634_28405 [Plantactinospora veratri]|uniref:Uncharacterized protein n=1 Tax=Plantactinospora veratri TaxID=1436122 RepID=A0ABU7SM35_9ACTN